MKSKSKATEATKKKLKTMSKAAKIHSLRDKLKLTQIDFADMLGVSSIAVSKWENSRATPTGDLVVALISNVEQALSRGTKPSAIVKAGADGPAYLLARLLNSKTKGRVGNVAGR